MSELQAGMLALVVGLSRDTEYNGIMVILKYQVTPDNIEDFHDVEIGDWVVEHQGEDIFGTFMPKNLIPIRPEQDPLDVTHKEELHA